MTILVAGATGATGRLLVQQLLDRGHAVKVIVRSPEKLPDSVRDHERLSIIQAPILDLGDEQLAEQVKGCEAVASCLGHNITRKGILGKPRRLVTDATRRLCQAIQSHPPEQAVKFVLMNTVGNRNRDLSEPLSFAHKIVIGLVRLMVPPQVDNEQAAEFLRSQIGQGHPQIEWVAVRPDTLLNEEEVTDYEIVPSPTRSAVFNPGKTSRINVAHFMAELIVDDQLWGKWMGQMPVIYNV
jgi:nucleoside-diphosphate-sugar epimerase